MSLTSAHTLRETLAQRDNDYSDAVRRFEHASGLPWHQPTPSGRRGASIAVVIPAHNVAYCLSRTLDALHGQQTQAPFEVIVVDDASTDATAGAAARHPLQPTVVRLPTRQGSAAARNAGTAVTQAETILYLDADMVLPSHAVADVAVRADPGLVLVGFRHNVPFGADEHGQARVPLTPARLDADHRVCWTPPVGRILPYSGITLDAPVDGRPLDATDDFRDLGGGRWYYDWDLPRMVVTATVAVPRAAVLHVGGFYPPFGQAGWGCDDTHLGAMLISAGLCVVPLRQLVGYHLDPPAADAVWKAKLASWPDTLALYQHLLDQPPPQARGDDFHRMTRAQLADAVIIR